MAIYSYSTVPASNVSINGIDVNELCRPANINDAIRQLMADVRAGVANQGTTLTAAGTVDIGAATGQYVQISGNTTISAFASVAAGVERTLVFNSTPTIQYNGTSLILPTAANITAAAGDAARFVSEGSGNWRCVVYQRASGGLLLVASETVVGAIEHATDAEVRAATTGNLAVTPAKLESASALVALTDDSTVAVNWDAGINFSLTVQASRIIGNPTNGQPGTWRTILIQGDDTTDRTITFDSQYLGEVPTITDCDSGRWYLLSIYCVTASHFVVSSKKAKGS